MITLNKVFILSMAVFVCVWFGVWKSRDRYSAITPTYALGILMETRWRETSIVKREKVDAKNEPRLVDRERAIKSTSSRSSRMIKNEINIDFIAFFNAFYYTLTGSFIIRLY